MTAAEVRNTTQLTWGPRSPAIASRPFSRSERRKGARRAYRSTCSSSRRSRSDPSRSRAVFATARSRWLSAAPGASTEAESAAEVRGSSAAASRTGPSFGLPSPGPSWGVGGMLGPVKSVLRGVGDHRAPRRGHGRAAPGGIEEVVPGRSGASSSTGAWRGDRTPQSAHTQQERVPGHPDTRSCCTVIAQITRSDHDRLRRRPDRPSSRSPGSRWSAPCPRSRRRSAAQNGSP